MRMLRTPTCTATISTYSPHHGASRYKVLRTNLKHPDLAHPDVIVPEGQAVLRDLRIASDALYALELDGGIGRLLRVPYAGGKAEQVALPFEGAVNEFFSDERAPGVVVRTESWAKPRVHLQYDPRTAKMVDLKLAPPPPVDVSQVESREVKAKSAEREQWFHCPSSSNVACPMDGSAPTILSGYGAYGITQDPVFSPYVAGMGGARRCVRRLPHPRRRRVWRGLAQRRSHADQTEHYQRLHRLC